MSNLKNKTMNILTAEKVKALQYADSKNSINSLNDGAGLRIVANKDNRKVWKFIYTLNGIRKDTSFGTYPKVTLSGARIKAKEFRELLEKSIDPLENKKEQKEKQQEEKQKKQHQISIIADRYFELLQHNKGIKSITVIKNKQKLQNHIYPHLKAKEKTIIHKIKFDDIVKALNILENNNKLNSISRIKRIVVNIFKFAYTENIIKDIDIYAKLELKTFKEQQEVRGNPTFVKEDDIKRLYNAMLNYNKFGIVTKYALLLSIHTAQRQGSISQAKWENISFKDKLWVIPAEDMKNNKIHHLPLSSQMIDYLKELHLLTGTNKFLFPNQRNNNKGIDKNTVNNAIRRMGFTEEEQTAHGLRSMVKTVCKENQTTHNLNNEFVERILTHKTEGIVEQVYNRAKNIEDMRVIMQWWSDYLTNLKERVK